MTSAVDNCLKPSFFVSYSRKQESVAHLLKEILSKQARAVWFDRDSILFGDLWFQEIREGIAEADELVLVLSADSLASEMVRKEVELALEGGKLIRPVAVSRLPPTLPEHLRDIHYLDVSDAPARDDLEQRLHAHFGMPEEGARPDARLKLHASRMIWPRFSESFVTASGNAQPRAFAAELEQLQEHYAPASAIRLNAGLMLCIAGRWDEGLDLLRSYAQAANNFAGWYFLALHLLRREAVLGAPLGRVKEAVAAVHAALALEANPLALLVAAVLETGGRNLGPANLRRRVHDFLAVSDATPDQASEYLRLIWCLKPSFGVLGPYEPLVRTRIREMAS